MMNEPTRSTSDATPRPETSDSGPAQAAAPEPAPAQGAAFPGGVPLVAPRMQDPRSKSPVLACILSLMPGLGQIYVGYYLRGFVHAIVVGLLITWTVASGTTGANGPLPLIPLFLVFFWLYNVIDAGRKAALFNQALAGGTAIDLPSDFVMPSFHGSIGAGSALVGGGFILLLHTRFGMTLDWIEEWWPLAPIAFGAYLVVKAVYERGSKESV